MRFYSSTGVVFLKSGGCDSILEYFVERREFPRAPLLQTLLFRQAISLGFGEVLKLLLAHRLGHLSGSAFERRLRFFAAFAASAAPAAIEPRSGNEAAPERRDGSRQITGTLNLNPRSLTDKTSVS